MVEQVRAGVGMREVARAFRLIDWFGKLIATPHVLSQVSDLTDLPGRDPRARQGGGDELPQERAQVARATPQTSEPAREQFVQINKDPLKRQPPRACRDPGKAAASSRPAGT